MRGLAATVYATTNPYERAGRPSDMLDGIARVLIDMVEAAAVIRILVATAVEPNWPSRLRYQLSA